MNGNGIGNLFLVAKSSGIKVAANGLLQLSPRSFIARFRIDLMHEKILLTDDELSSRENRHSLNADASLGANEVMLIVDVASLR